MYVTADAHVYIGEKYFCGSVYFPKVFILILTVTKKINEIENGGNPVYLHGLIRFLARKGATINIALCKIKAC